MKLKKKETNDMKADTSELKINFEIFLCLSESVSKKAAKCIKIRSIGIEITNCGQLQLFGIQTSLAK